MSRKGTDHPRRRLQVIRKVAHQSPTAPLPNLPSNLEFVAMQRTDKQSHNVTRRSFTASFAATALAGSTGLIPTLSHAAPVSLKGAGFPVLLSFVNQSAPLRLPHSPVDRATDLVTPAMYVSPTQHTTLIGGKRLFDHSAAGINAASKRIADTLIKIARTKNTRIAMFDVEGYNSINVPSSVGYSPSKYTDRAARYDYRAPIQLRKEAARYHHATITAVKSLVGRAVPGFEVGCYNVPSLFLWYKYGLSEVNSSIASTELAELGGTVLPLLSFSGPQAQLLIDQRMSDGLKNGSVSYNDLISWHATSVSVRRRVLGSKARIMPTIWPRLFAFGGAKLPGGSAALPRGFMTRFCNALLDAGANGFVCWLPSSDFSLSASDQQALANSWAEVIAVARGRGFRRLG